MIYVFDLDGTLCDTAGRDYMLAVQRIEMIAKVNALFDAGHHIIIDSARGSVTGEPWEDRTRTQLEGWGLRFHALRTGQKFYGDVYVDDKAKRPKEFLDATD